MLTELNQDLRVFRTPSPGVSEVALGKTHCQESTHVIFYPRMMMMVIFRDSNIQTLIAQSFVRSFNIR